LADLARIGGLDVKDTTSRILGHVFGQSIAEKTSRTGKGAGNKYGFMQLKCASVIIGENSLQTTF